MCAEAQLGREDNSRANVVRLLPALLAWLPFSSCHKSRSSLTVGGDGMVMGR